jgi:hypothetical protein
MMISYMLGLRLDFAWMSWLLYALCLDSSNKVSLPFEYKMMKCLDIKSITSIQYQIVIS